MAGARPSTSTSEPHAAHPAPAATDPQASIGGELLSVSVKRLLLDRIMHGHYQPGERIIELKVAKELGISQSPVREALRDLRAIGIITIHSRRGARVRLPTSKELADISLVRSEIDALAATSASSLMTEETLSQLRDAFEEMKAHQLAGEHTAMTQADARFHRIIVITSANEAIQHVFDQLEPFARTFITLTLPRADLRTIIGEHGRILEALEQGNADLAAQHARTHQLNVSALFRDHFGSDEPSTTGGEGAA